VLFRAVLRAGPLAVRLAMTAAALVTVVIGLAVSPAVQIAALMLVVSAGIVVESRGLPWGHVPKHH
jgi:hypothetical protein